MRAKRALEDVARLAGNARQPEICSKHKGKDKDTTVTRQAMQTPSHSLQPGVLTQERNVGETSSGSSRVRLEAAAGRQSVLEKYWNASALAAEQLEESQSNFNTDADPWF
jgi:hypothetical protein